MDDHLASFVPISTIKENTVEMSYDGGWLEVPNLSSSTPLDVSSSFLHSSDIYMRYFNPNHCQIYFEDETDMKPLDDYHAFFDNRLIQAIEFLNERCTTDADVLIQLWLPVIRGGKRILTTANQPFLLNSDSTKLSRYRQISKSYQFTAEDNSTEMTGLPGRVFLKKFPICTPDLQLAGEENDPRLSYAQKLNLCGCLNLPIFELGDTTCLGIVEVVTTSQKVNFRNEIENICKALEAVNLTSSEFLIHPKLEDFSEPYQVVLAEIRDVLKSVCDTLKLPLAQTWGPCEGRSQQQPVASISIIESASYVFDPQLLSFHEVCSQQQLVQGEGIAGKALGTNQPCFTADITAFCRTEYPLVHQARMFGLRGAVAIRLRSAYTGLMDFILEFFLPRDCKDDEEQRQLLCSMASVIHDVSRSLYVMNGEGLAEAASFSVKQRDTQDESWISHMLEPQRRGESVVVSMGCHRDEPEEEFKMINQFYHVLTFSEPEKQTHRESETKARSRTSGTRRPTKKNQAKTERNISLQVLQQYFPGSLKDAAKSIGVCPTTLKRICRQHGIMRWPSRKIKKVGHSLKKLQLVIDSVQGAEGTIQLGSFYANFPELSSTISPGPRPKVNDRINLLKAQTTASNSSSSGSHDSSSSLCCSTGIALYTEKSCGLLKRPCNDSSFTKDLLQEERNLLVRYENNKLADDCHSPEILAPAPKSSSPISQDESVFRVKATYGEEKIRFRMSQSCSFGDLQHEIMRRFNIYDVDNITLEYLDDDSEWVLLTCDADLEECMDIHISTKNRTIKLFLHQSSHPALLPMVHPNYKTHIW